MCILNVLLSQYLLGQRKHLPEVAFGRFVIGLQVGDVTELVQVLECERVSLALAPQSDRQCLIVNGPRTRIFLRSSKHLAESLEVTRNVDLPWGATRPIDTQCFAYRAFALLGPVEIAECFPLPSQNSRDEIRSPRCRVASQCQRLRICFGGSIVIGLPATDLGKREILTRTQARIETRRFHALLDKGVGAAEQAKISVNFTQGGLQLGTDRWLAGQLTLDPRCPAIDDLTCRWVRAPGRGRVGAREQGWRQLGGSGRG